MHFCSLCESKISQIFKESSLNVCNLVSKCVTHIVYSQMVSVNVGQIARSNKKILKVVVIPIYLFIIKKQNFVMLKVTFSIVGHTINYTYHFV
jgi:hypothetical protein